LQEFIFVLTHYEKNVLTTIDFTSDHAISLSVASSIAMSKYPKKIMQAREEVQDKTAVMQLMPPVLKTLGVVLLR
jgi:uncharacterized membrane protein